MHIRNQRAGMALLSTLFLAAACGGPLAESPAHAYGTKAKGMAGAGVALPQDARAPRMNPAGLVFVGDRVDAGLAGMATDRSYAVIGAPSGLPGTTGLPVGVYESKGGAVWVPNAAANWMLGERSSFGVLAFGHGILHTDYPGGSAISTQQLWVLPTYARKIGESSSWGASAVLVYHRFRAKGIAFPNAYVSDGLADNLSDKGHDTALGFGAKLGVQSEVVPGLTLAASYLTKVRMGRLDRYSDLLPDRGRFDSPPVLMVGLAWAPTESSTIAFDVERTFNSEVPALANPFSKFAHGVLTQTTSELLGGSDGAGFGWRNVNTYKLGYQWRASDRWTWRAGASYGQQPIAASEVMLNTNGVNVQEWRLTAGMTHAMGDRHELSASLMLSPRNRVSGPNPLEAPGQQAIELRNQEWEIETAYAWRF